MNKKILILFFSISAIFLPLVSRAVSACDLLKQVYLIAYQIGGTLVVIGWVIAGIIYLSSVGKQEQMTTGKRAISAAIIGTVLIILAAFSLEIIKSFFGGVLPGSVPTCP